MSFRIFRGTGIKTSDILDIVLYLYTPSHTYTLHLGHSLHYDRYWLDFIALLNFTLTLDPTYGILCTL